MARSQERGEKNETDTHLRDTQHLFLKPEIARKQPPSDLYIICVEHSDYNQFVPSFLSNTKRA